jgi:hypothetical protein
MYTSCNRHADSAGCLLVLAVAGHAHLRMQHALTTGAFVQMHPRLAAIKAILDADSSDAAFCCSGDADNLPEPDLHVNGVGNIDLPLRKAQAEEIAHQCERAPYGHGERTKRSKTVRDSWQLAPDNFDIRKAGWDAALQQLKDIVCKELDAAQVRAMMSVPWY